MESNVARLRVARITREVSSRRAWETPAVTRDRLGAIQEVLARMGDELAPGSARLFGAAAQELTELLARPGKRIRPLLCTLGYEAASGDATLPAGVLRFAAGLELLHVFLLVHDDVADRAESRRGAPALHVLLRPDAPELGDEARRHLGDQLAIVAGDWLYTRALQTMLGAPGLRPLCVAEAVDCVLETCRFTAEGQYADLVLSGVPLELVRPEDVLEVYRLKTARYSFEGPLVAGALLGGAEPETLAALRRFGTSAGIAFQLLDDLLGIFASEEETGKPPLADLREAKRTWPLLQARAAASVEERCWLDDVLRSRDADWQALERVRRLVRETGSLSRTIEEIERHCASAREALESLEPASVRSELSKLLSRVQRGAAACR